MQNDMKEDEIVFEKTYKLDLFDYAFYLIALGLGIICLIATFDEVSMRYNPIVLAFIIYSIYSFRAIFYKHKNRFYVTNYGIGFERRHWFRIQKKFFRFGEMNIYIVYVPTNVGAPNDIIIAYPIDDKIKEAILSRAAIFPLPKNCYKTEICPVICKDEARDILTFIRQKTKEALESQGKSISDEELKEKFKDFSHKDI